MASRGVLTPPYAGARGLLDWCIDLWPYVNGKALMSGLKLAEMETSEMLDVVHFILETDVTYSSAEQAESRSTMRQLLYRDLYKQEYKYAMQGTSSTEASGRVGKDRLKDFDIPDEVQYDIKKTNKKEATKPYIRPTLLTEDALSAALEPPLN
jgi:hypothetical protein